VLTESPTPYFVLLVAAAAIATLVWVRRQQGSQAILIALGGAGGLWAWGAGSVTAYGLATFGELVAFHFIAIVSFIVCVGLVQRWRARAELGPARGGVAALATIGASGMLAAHLVQALDMGPVDATWEAAARVLLLMAWAGALALHWRAPGLEKWVPLILISVVAVRIGLAGTQAVYGAAVPPERAAILGTVILIASGGVLLVFRPRLETYVRVGVALISLVACLIFVMLYYQVFGEYEAGLQPLMRSVFGFDIPLPYVESPGWWRPAVSMVAVFFALYVTYAAIVSTRDRTRGIALAMIGVAGIHLRSPSLVLLASAGMLLFIDTLEPRPSARTRSQSEIFEAFVDLSARLGLAEPLSIPTGKRRVVALTGRHQGVEIDLRARPRGHGWSAELDVGVLGTGAAPLRLVPDTTVTDSVLEHPVARTHRLEGEVRRLEALGDELLDALIRFPTGTFEGFDAGARVSLADVASIDVDAFDSLIRAIVRASTRAS
jgi:hypothetical protein